MRWERVKPNPSATLRGHIPIDEWRKDYNSQKFSVVTIYRTTNGKEKGKYFVEVWLGGEHAITSKTFKTKEEAVNFAKKIVNVRGD